MERERGDTCTMADELSFTSVRQNAKSRVSRAAPEQVGGVGGAGTHTRQQGNDENEKSTEATSTIELPARCKGSVHTSARGSDCGGNRASQTGETEHQRVLREEQQQRDTHTRAQSDAEAGKEPRERGVRGDG